MKSVYRRVNIYNTREHIGIAELYFPVVERLLRCE
jgi:hypothetical protein